MTKTIFNLSDFVDGETGSMVSLTQPCVEFIAMVDDFKPLWKILHTIPDHNDKTEQAINKMVATLNLKYGASSPEMTSWDSYFNDGVDTESLFEMKVYTLYQHRGNKLSSLFFLDRIEADDNQAFENDEWGRYTHTFQTKIPKTLMDDQFDADELNGNLPDIGFTRNMFPVEKLKAKSIYSSQAILPGLNPRDIYDLMIKHGAYSEFATKLPLPKFGTDEFENSGQLNHFAFLGGKTYFLTTFNSLSNLIRTTSFRTAEGETPYVKMLNISEADYNRIDDIVTQTNFFQAFDPDTNTSKIIQEYKKWFDEHNQKILINPDMDLQFNTVSYLSYIGKSAYEFAPSANGVHLVSTGGAVIDASLSASSNSSNGVIDGTIDLSMIAKNAKISFISDLGMYNNHYETNTPSWMYVKIPYTPLSDHVYLKFQLQFLPSQSIRGNDFSFFGKNGYMGVILRMDDNSRDDVKFFTFASDSPSSGDVDNLQVNFGEDSTSRLTQYLRKGKIIVQDDQLSSANENDDIYRVARALDKRECVEFQIKIQMDPMSEADHVFKIGFISNLDSSAYRDSNGYLDLSYDIAKNIIKDCQLRISNIQIINPAMEANPEQNLSWGNYISAGKTKDDQNKRAEDFFTVSRIVNDLPYQKVVECDMSLRTSYNKKLFAPFTSADIFADTFTTKSFENAEYRMDVIENVKDYLFKFNSHRKYTNILSCGNKLSLIYQDEYNVNTSKTNETINGTPTFKMEGESSVESELFTKGAEYLSIEDLNEASIIDEGKVPIRYQKVETIDRINRFDNSIKHKANIFSVHVKNSGVSDYEKEIKYKVDNKLITQDEYEHKKTLIDSVRKQISLNIKQMAEKLAPATNQLVKIYID